MNFNCIDKFELYDILHIYFEDLGVITKYSANINSAFELISAFEFIADTMWYCQKIDIIEDTNEAIVYLSKLPAEEDMENA